MDYTVRTAEQLPSILRAFRRANDLNQTELARRLGVTQQALSELERVPQSASFERLLQLLSTLNVDVVLRSRPALDEGTRTTW